MSSNDVKKSAVVEGRLYAGESLADRQLRRRQQFLDAGLTLFGTVGYRKTTVRALCKEAQLTDRYFYESFATTEDLLVAVYERQFDALREKVMAAVAQHGDSTDFSGLIRIGLDAVFTMAADPRVARFCWLEVLGVSPRIDMLYSKTFCDFADLLVALLTRFLPRTGLPEDETRALGIAMVGAVSQSVTFWLLDGYRIAQPAMVNATARVVAGVVLTLDVVADTRR